MMLVTTLKVGRLTVHALEAGTVRLDGGAMFGVVPKPLWQRRIPADERNRIRLAMRTLLIEHDDGLMLVDSGLGNKEAEKFRDIFGVENAGANGRTLLEDAIVATGHQVADVRTVINTHLHFDHAGGNTWIAPDDAARRVQAAFPKARYLVHQREFDDAAHPNERTQANYLAANFVPLAEAGKYHFVEGTEHVVAPGVRVMVTPGHTPWHLSVLIESDGDTLFYPADTLPTAHHLPLAWNMAYDVEPLRTLETKRALYPRAIADNWLVVFEHDSATLGGRLQQGTKGVELVEPVTAPVA